MSASRIGVFQAGAEQVCAESRSARDRRRFGSKRSISSLEEMIGADPEGDDNSVAVPDGGSHVVGIPSHGRLGPGSGQLDRPRVTFWQAAATRLRHTLSCRRAAIYVAVVLITVTACHLFSHHYQTVQAYIASDTGRIVELLHLMPDLPDEYHDKTKEHAPDQWIRQNSFLDPSLIPSQRLQKIQATRPKAALVALVRNSELGDMIHTIAQVEARFNSKELHRYDWVFFNDEDFTEQFKSAVANSTSSGCFFERIPKKHWSLPSWIDKARFDRAHERLKNDGVDKAWLENQHHMRRWSSGLFALEERLQGYKWFWRADPGVVKQAEYACHLEYDIFRFMQENNMAYGFNMAILDDAQWFSSLWQTTQAFRNTHKQLVHKEANMDWALHRSQDPDSVIRAASMIYDTPATGEQGQNNHCQFYSNFEIGSLDFFRGSAHQAYFRHLDKSGGFYYERFGNTAVHALSTSMLLPKHRVWYFQDIGYSDSLCKDCPRHSKKLPADPESDSKKIRMAELEAGLKKSREILHIHQLNIEKDSKAFSLQSGCTIGGLAHDNSKFVPYKTMKKRPNATCFREWFEGDWLPKKNEWSREDKMTLGGSGYGGHLFGNKESDLFNARPLMTEEDPQGKRPEWVSRIDNGDRPDVCTVFSLIILWLMTILFLQ